jgi:hypothetical protein
MSAAKKIESPKPRAKRRKPLRVRRSKFDLSLLKEPFEPDEIEWKVISQGHKNKEPWAVVVPYIKARAVMNRLDDVVGPANWKDDISPIGSGFFCSLAIKIDGEWVSKTDGADETDIDAFKGGISDARKRAGVLWGIGRYLYEVPQMFAHFSQVYKSTKGAQPIDIEVTPACDGESAEFERFYWLPPELPKWALPMKAVELQKIRVEKEAKERREKLAAQPKSATKIQNEIASLCVRRGIAPGILNSYVALMFGVNNPEHLTIDQLEELHEQIEEGKVSV